MGGAGVQRSVKFVKWLPTFGIMPVLITSNEPRPTELTPPDPTLARDIPPEIEIHRTPPCIRPSSGLGARIRRMTGAIPASAEEWNSNVFKLGSSLLEKRPVDVIYVSMSPFWGCEVADALSRRFGVPWVADLRDPWALDEMQTYTTGVHHRLAIRRMGRSLGSASTIVMNTPEALRRLKETFPALASKRCVSITNGYDEDDLVPAEPESDGHFHIVHMGSLHTELGLLQKGSQRLWRALGRTPVSVNYLGRSHYYLVQALDKWLDSEPAARSKVKVDFIGGHSQADLQVVQGSRYPHIYKFSGYLSHSAALQELARADLLFFPMYGLDPGVRSTIVPGKAYEYLASRKPILAAVPEGDARDFMRKAGTGFVCEPDDVAGMARVLHERYAAWIKKSPDFTWNEAFVCQFERRHLAERMAGELALASGENARVEQHCATFNKP